MPPKLEEYGLEFLAEAERRQHAARDAAQQLLSIMEICDIREPLDKWSAAERRYSRSLRRVTKYIDAAESDFGETASPLNQEYKALVGKDRDPFDGLALRDAIRDMKEEAWNTMSRSSVLEIPYLYSARGGDSQESKG